MSARNQRDNVIPIAWRTCPHCLQRYDEGNPFAAFAHRYRECVAPTPALES